MPIPESILRASIQQLDLEWPQLAKSLGGALSAITAREALSDESLSALSEAASSKRQAVSELASYLLGIASTYEPQAAALILKLSSDSRVHIRHNAILCLVEETPPSISLDVIRRTLFDKSSRVRIKAADWVLRLRLAAAIPLLERAIDAESHRQTLSAMAFTLDLVRDGYRLEPVDAARVRIFYANEHQVSGATVDRSLIAQRGVAAVVASLQSTGRAA